MAELTEQPGEITLELDPFIVEFTGTVVASDDEELQGVEGEGDDATLISTVSGVLLEVESNGRWRHTTGSASGGLLPGRYVLSGDGLERVE